MRRRCGRGPMYSPCSKHKRWLRRFFVVHWSDWNLQYMFSSPLQWFTPSQAVTSHLVFPKMSFKYFLRIPTRASLCFWRHYLQRKLPKQAGRLKQTVYTSALKSSLQCSEELNKSSDNMPTFIFPASERYLWWWGGYDVILYAARSVCPFRFRCRHVVHSVIWNYWLVSVRI